VLLARCLWTRERSERERGRLLAEGRKILAIKSGGGTAVVTQLPLYNEATVAERAIRAAAAMEWPFGPHQVQVLDDSTDETRGIVDAVAASLRADGADVVVVRRANREGFKAGALAQGMAQGDAEFIAIFDGDFVPPSDFLLRTVPVLAADTRLGWAQGRWTHLNAADNTITRAQAAGIDPHFIIEQQARSAGWFMNFNGTAGVWRRRAIEDAGGWSDATLTEDLDLFPTACNCVAGAAFSCRKSPCPAKCPPTPRRSRASNSAGRKARCKPRCACCPRCGSPSVRS